MQRFRGVRFAQAILTLALPACGKSAPSETAPDTGSLADTGATTTEVGDVADALVDSPADGGVDTSFVFDAAAFADAASDAPCNDAETIVWVPSIPPPGVDNCILGMGTSSGFAHCPAGTVCLPGPSPVLGSVGCATPESVGPCRVNSCGTIGCSSTMNCDSGICSLGSIGGPLMPPDLPMA